MPTLRIDTKNLMSSKFPEGDIQLFYTLPWTQGVTWKKSDMDKLCEEFLTSLPKEAFIVELVNQYGREVTVAMSSLVVRASFPYGYLKD